MDLPSDDLISLLRAARGGCDQAMGTLLESCRKYLFSVANSEFKSELRGKAGASDVVQESMLEAYRDFGQFEGVTEQSLAAWMRGILRNNLDDFLRSYCATDKRQISLEVSLDGSQGQDLAGTIAQLDASPSSLVVQQELEESVERALAKLPADYRQVVEFRNRFNYSFAECGQRMGRTPDAARMLWYRAVEQLTELLHPCDQLR